MVAIDQRRYAARARPADSVAGGTTDPNAALLIEGDLGVRLPDHRGDPLDGRLDPLPGVEDRPLPVQGLAFHVTAQRRVVKLAGGGAPAVPARRPPPHAASGNPPRR